MIFQNYLFSLDQSQNFKLGIYGGGNINFHFADFYKLNGIPNCCPDFEYGNGFGFNSGLLFEYKFDDNYWIGGRFGLMILDGELIKNEPTIIHLENGSTNGVFEHRLNGFFTNLSIEPQLLYYLNPKLQLSLGIKLGKNINATFNQEEQISKPDGYGTFLDSLGNDSHSRIRNKFSGEIPDAIPFQISFTSGVSYELPLNKRANLMLVPEISLNYPLTELVKNTDWVVSSLRGGIALKFRPLVSADKIIKYKQEYKIDTIKYESDVVADNTIKLGTEIRINSFTESEFEDISLETITRTDTLFTPKIYKLNGKITAVGLDSAGNEISNPVFKIEEFISNRLDPLLNYIFFEKNSSELLSRYKLLGNSDIDKFVLDSLFRESTLEIYHNILNIIGSRMKLYSEGNITIKGCNSGVGDEKNNLDLSLKRAESVKNYLVQNWGIDSDRIIIKSTNLPQKASTPLEDNEKCVENQRVEIYSNNDKILEPVFIQKIDRIATPPIIRFHQSFSSELELKSWELKAWQDGNNSNYFYKSGTNNFTDTVHWFLNSDQKLMPTSSLPINYNLSLSDLKNNKININSKTLPVEIITLKKKRNENLEDFEIEKFSLILFDFDKSIIEGNNKQITNLISNRIKANSEIEIIGYTDRTGDDDYNQKLSEKRAISTMETLKLKDAKIKGIGEIEQLFDNDLPEGRFYNRTVVVTIKTIVK